MRGEGIFPVKTYHQQVLDKYYHHSAGYLPPPESSFRRRPESRRGGVGQDRHTIGKNRHPTILILLCDPRSGTVIPAEAGNQEQPPPGNGGNRKPRNANPASHKCKRPGVGARQIRAGQAPPTHLSSIDTVAAADVPLASGRPTNGPQ